MAGRLIIRLFIMFLFVLPSAGYSARPKTRAPQPQKITPVIEFLKKNGLRMDKRVVLIRVSGQDYASRIPKAVVKVVAITDKTSVHYRQGSAQVIGTVVDAIINGQVVDDGSTAKVGELEVYLEDGSNFKVFVGEDFSQIVFFKKPSQDEEAHPDEDGEIKDLISFKSDALKKAVMALIRGE